MEKILDTVKEICDVSLTDSSFDNILKIHINTVLFTLKQLGVSNETFSVVKGTEKWDDFLDNIDDLEAVKSYVGLKVKSLFDPPTGSLREALNDSIKEYEWRLNIQVDPGWEEDYV